MTKRNISKNDLSRLAFEDDSLANGVSTDFKLSRPLAIEDDSLLLDKVDEYDFIAGRVRAPMVTKSFDARCRTNDHSDWKSPVLGGAQKKNPLQLKCAKMKNPHLAVARGPRATLAYLEALKYGQVKLRTMKLMFVGQGRAGKTTTLRRMTGRRLNPDEETTHGIQTMSLVRDFVQRWRLLKTCESGLHEEELNTHVAKMMADKIALEQDGFSPEVRDDCAPISKMTVNLVAHFLKQKEGSAVDLKTDSDVVLKTWDFGGQKEYYVMHHMFMTNHSLYVVVTRLDHFNRALDEDPMGILCFWLASIHLNAPTSKVVIVATHLDLALEGAVEAAEGEIEDLLERLPGFERQLVLNTRDSLCFFPLNNTAGSDEPDMGEFKKCIDGIVVEAVQSGFLSADVPLRWLQLREALDSKRDLSPVLSLEMVETELAPTCGGMKPGDVGPCLCYLHNIGDIIYFADAPVLRDYVLINPQWLACAMAHILRCRKFATGGSVTLRKKLLQTGRLDAKLLDFLWNDILDYKDLLILTLQRFHLLTPHPFEAGELLVPTFLPAAPSDIAHYRPWDLDEEGFYFDFHFLLAWLLPTLFPKMIAAANARAGLAANTSLPFANVTPVALFADEFYGLWKGETKISMDLLPKDRPQVLRIVGVMRHWGIIQDIMGLITEIFPAASFTAGMLCSRCLHDQEYHILDLQDVMHDQVLVCKRTGHLADISDSWNTLLRQVRNEETTMCPSSAETRVHYMYACPLSVGHEGLINELKWQHEYCLLGKESRASIDLLSLENLRDVLHRRRPTFLHLALHASVAGFLFEDDWGGAQAVTPDVFERVWNHEVFSGALILNCCHGYSIAKNMRLCPSIICVDGLILDTAANLFCRAFYRSWANGKTIAGSFDIARESLATAAQVGLRREAAKYKLLGTAEANARTATSVDFQQTSDEELEGQRIGVARLPHKFASRVENFTGRNREMQNIIGLLRTRRAVCVTSATRGVGRSALLIELSHFLNAPGRYGAYGTIPIQGDRPVEEICRSVHSMLTTLGAESYSECTFSSLIPRLQTFAQQRQRGVVLVVDTAAVSIQPFLNEALSAVADLAVIFSGIPWRAMGACKVVHVPLAPLLPMDAAQLFLTRIHRPLFYLDLKIGGEEVIVRIDSGRKNILDLLVQHPLLHILGGIPAEILRIADEVVPGSPTLWELAERIRV